MSALRRILEGDTASSEVTDVIVKPRFSIIVLLILAAAAFGQNNPTSSPTQRLFFDLQSVGLDSSRVYTIRNAYLDRGAIHISLDSGTIAFTQAVDGKVTGAFFVGDGEILLSPPNTVERASLALFVGAAILEERFGLAYFRFNDDISTELKSSLRPAEDAAAFANQWNKAAKNLAEEDALRILLSMTNGSPQTQGRANSAGDDRMFHAYIQGNRLGAFEVRYDGLAPEQVSAGQHTVKDGVGYYNLWTSFSNKKAAPSNADPDNELLTSGDFGVTQFQINTQITPPTEISAIANLTIMPRRSGSRALLFELSRLLQVRSVTLDGTPTEFIHNPAIEGSQLSKRGNDALAVFVPAPIVAGKAFHLEIRYDGEVLSQAANGLLYVGEHGTWYPNVGFQMSSFDLKFHYPAGWTLVATGRRSTLEMDGPVQVSRWVSEKQVPVAGFNLGKYRRASDQAGSVVVETFATQNVEKGFVSPKSNEAPIPDFSRVPRMPLSPIEPGPVSPSRNLQMVNNSAVEAVNFYQKQFGPYPYSSLALTQFPGKVSQGWPGLIFLSSYAFLSPEEAQAFDADEANRLALGQLVAHETAHQWWGDLVSWSGYRDQWLMEALANYSSMMLLESKNPEGFHQLMQRYRDNLLIKNKDGNVLLQAGPVTLGVRLSSSEFPEAYEAISYGRGTWLLHMLRTMLRDAEPTNLRQKGGEEPFVRALRRLRTQYEGRTVTTTQFLAAFETELPRSLWYEGKPSLSWFFDSWLNGTAVPEFRLKDAKFSDRPGGTLITGTILQEDAPDTLVTSVPIYASANGKEIFLGRVFADGPETSFRFVGPGGARKLLIDPQNTLLSRK